MASARPTPWTIRYSDGAGNAYSFRQASAGGDVLFEYDPVRPEMSSTGRYSGGDPRTAIIQSGDAQIDELWGRVEALAADQTLHQEHRNKGTGAFALKTPEGTRTFIVQMGDEITDLDAFLQQFGRTE